MQQTKQPNTMNQPKQQLQTLLSQLGTTIKLSDEVTMQIIPHEVRFSCMDCAFVLSQLFLERGQWHILPVNLHDFHEPAIALVNEAIKQTFLTDGGIERAIALNAEQAHFEALRVTMLKELENNSATLLTF
jgi:hypothetical protein